MIGTNNIQRTTANLEEVSNMVFSFGDSKNIWSLNGKIDFEFLTVFFGFLLLPRKICKSRLQLWYNVLDRRLLFSVSAQQCYQDNKIIAIDPTFKAGHVGGFVGYSNISAFDR